MRALAVIVALSLAVAALGCTASAEPEAASESVTATTRAKVAYAVDGDTLRVRLPSGALTYVRLIGIDTPEDVRPGYPTECGARAAAASMHRLAPDGAPIILRPDSLADTEDRYGRLLAHAFIARHQLEIAQLRRGLASVYRYDDLRFEGLLRFQAASDAARQASRGVWGAATVTSTPPSPVCRIEAEPQWPTDTSRPLAARSDLCCVPRPNRPIPRNYDSRGAP